MVGIFGITPENFFHSFFLPFILTFVIFWGLLEAVRVFGRRINLVLAFVFTFAAWYGGLFEWFSSSLVQFGAWFGVAAFFIVFIIGITLWAFGRGREIYYETLAPEKKVRNIDKKIEKLWREYEKRRDPSILKTIESLEMQRRAAEREAIRR